MSLNDPTIHRFRHLLFTSRVPFEDGLDLDLDGWSANQTTVQYGVVLLDEFRSKPDSKEFQYEHRNGDRLRVCFGRLGWKSHVRHMAVAKLPAGTDVSEFDADKPWNQLVEWPLQTFDADSVQFKILSLRYQKLSAVCDENTQLLRKIQKRLDDVEIEYCQEWLRLNFIPSKDSLKPIIDHEFLRFVTCFDLNQLDAWMNDQTNCLHWKGTYDMKTNTAMFKRSTKLTGRNVRRCVNVKELLYQFFIGNLGGYEALYLDFDKCIHRSKCVNPHHFSIGRRQSLNNCSKRRKLIAASSVSLGASSSCD